MRKEICDLRSSLEFTENALEEKAKKTWKMMWKHGDRTARVL